MNMSTTALLPCEIAQLDLARLKHMFTIGTGADMTPEQWDEALLEYRLFLTLKLKHPTEALVPSKQVSTIWHAHILDTRAYRDDCDRLFGRFVDHYPYFGIYGEEDQQAMMRAFKHTQALYKAEFGAYPSNSPSNVPTSYVYHAPGVYK